MYANQYADPYSDEHSDKHGDKHADPHRHSQPDFDAYGHCLADLYLNGHLQPKPVADVNPDGHSAACNAYRHNDADRHRNADHYLYPDHH